MYGARMCASDGFRHQDRRGDRCLGSGDARVHLRQQSLAVPTDRQTRPGIAWAMNSSASSSRSAPTCVQVKKGDLVVVDPHRAVGLVGGTTGRRGRPQRSRRGGGSRRSSCWAAAAPPRSPLVRRSEQEVEVPLPSLECAFQSYPRGSCSGRAGRRRSRTRPAWSGRRSGRRRPRTPCARG